MASLTYKSGRAVVQWLDAKRHRRTVSIPGVNRTFAELARHHVGQMVNANLFGGTIPQKTAAWLAEIPDHVHAKLAEKGLADPRGNEGQDNPHTQLAAFLDRYIKGRTDLKERSIANLKQVRNGLVTFFKARRDMRTLNRGDLRDWHRWLLTEYATATVAMHVKRARQMFGDASDRGLCTAELLKGIKAGSQANEDRLVYVAEATIEQVIAACPDDEWKLIFALARYGGIRIPSELAGLRWSRVHWEQGRFVVRSPKTAHHKGKAERVVPIFKELLPYLLTAFEQAEPGEDRVIVRHRIENLRTTADKIIGRAGLTVWEKPFQNLRSSRETDLLDEYPIQAVCKWIGNSEAVARKHYLQVTEQHYDRAGVKSAAQSAAEGTGKDRKSPEPKSENPRKTEGFANQQYPQGGPNSPADFRDFLRLHAAALHQALHRLETAVPRIRERDIRVLRRAVHRARALTRKGGAAHA